MVKDPAEYRWSGYQVNALGKVSELFAHLQEYLSLGSDAYTRQKNYRELFKHHVDGELLEEIRENSMTGIAIGNARFKEELEALTGRRLKPRTRGRSVRRRKENN